MVSGTAIMITSATFVASATVLTSKPAASASERLFEPAARPMITLCPLSRRFSAWAWPCEP
jgi:hypothetical protein